jgi:hypothetical protein
LKVNYRYFEIGNEEKGEVTYKNSWITDKKIDTDNVKQIAECARARWKMRHKCRENEHNNVLKHRGYNLEHNGERGSLCEPQVRTGTARTMPAKYFACSI